MAWRHVFCIAVVLILFRCPTITAAVPSPSLSFRNRPQLWLYYSTNLLVPRNVARLERTWRRAAKYGYTHVMLSDSKLARMNDLGDIRKTYMAHLKAVETLARQLKLQIVPEVFQIGYSNDLLFENPSLAAGLPVRNVKFVVHNNVATPVRERLVRPTSAPSWKDNDVQLKGATATIHNNTGNSRLVFSIAVKPFHAYHIRVWIRTAAYSGSPHIRVLTKKDQELQFERVRVRATQPWRRYDVVFDSLQHRHVAIYFGVWGNARGELQWRRWTVSTAGLVNVLSRPGAPTTVAGYRSGIDYAPIRDPLLGNQPYAGEYKPWHKAPVIHFLHPVPNGTIIAVSWFYPPIFYNGQVSISLKSRQTRQLLRQQIMAIRAALHPQAYMMDFDEIRVMDWANSGPPGLAPGQELAACAHFCTGLLDHARAYVWSDMFDPYHNAHAHYFLVHGSLTGSWKGLDKRVVIVNWNFQHRQKSLHFFSARGYQQIIAGYYDAPLKKLRLWMTAARKVQGVRGYMYTTWRGDYKKLKRFAYIVDSYPEKFAKSAKPKPLSH